MSCHGLSRAGLIAAVVCTLWAAPFTAAQPAYSANKIGYIDVGFVAGSNFVANPLQRQVNSVSNLFHDVPDGSFLAPWDRNVQNFASTNFYRTTSGWTDPSATFLPPTGALLWLPAPATISFVGESWQPSTFPSQDQMYAPGIWVLGAIPQASPSPICSGIDTCPPQPPPLDTIFWKWVRTAQRFEIYTYVGVIPGYTDGWLDVMFNPANPSLDPDEAGVFEVTSTFWLPVLTPTQSVSSAEGVLLHQVSATSTNLTFRFASTNNAQFAVQRCTNLTENIWQVVLQDSAGASDEFTVTTPAAASGHAFYRVWPQITNGAPYLTHPSRCGTRFEFQFYASSETVYEIQRTAALANSDPGAWQSIHNVAAGPDTLVTVADTNAVAATSFYRIRYQP